MSLLTATRLLWRSRAAVGCGLPHRLLARMGSVGQPAHKVRRTSSSTVAAAGAAQPPASPEQPRAPSPPQHEQQAQPPAKQTQQEQLESKQQKQQFKQQQREQQQRRQEQQAPEGKRPKPVVMPTPVRPPAVPGSPSAWDSAVLLVDKPRGWTSFDVCGKLRHALAVLMRRKNRDVKVGHAGTLDPMATGLLIVCVGRGTKAVDAFMAMTKVYSGTLRLGEGTPSFDADTPVEERLPWEHITDEQLLSARDGLVGSIQQLPPMYSAIKVGGRRLYEAARKGQEVERQPRSVTVEQFDVWRDEADAQCVHFRVVCSKGTYIRSLAADLGRALGTAAHLVALRREAIGEHRVTDAWEIEPLADQIHALARQRKEEAAEQQQQAVGEGGGVPQAAAAPAAD